MVTEQSWLLLVYSVPREPSASRVSVWRKLRHLGAEALQDATWVLPANPRTSEQMQWLADEIRGMKGRATLWEARLASGDAALRRRFEAPVTEGYRKLLVALRNRRADLKALGRRFLELQGRDHFGCALGRRARAVLEKLNRRTR